MTIKSTSNSKSHVLRGQPKGQILRWPSKGHGAEVISKVTFKKNWDNGEAADAGGQQTWQNIKLLK